MRANEDVCSGMGMAISRYIELTPPIQKVDRTGNRYVSALVSSAGVPPRTVGSREGIDTIHTLNYPNLSSDPQRFIRNLIFEKFHGKGIRRRK